MAITRSVLLTMALAAATSSACNDRSTESQTLARSEQARPPAAEAHATPAERTPLATEPRLAASPTRNNADIPTTYERHVGSPTSHGWARALETVCHARQPAPTEAELRQVIHQVQARMDRELARANNAIIELQNTNATLQQTLAAEREQLADLRERLMSGRSIALQ
jgi:hypothetical protein